MKIVVEIKDKPKEGDIIIYRNGAFRLISGAKFQENVFENASKIAKMDLDIQDIQHTLAVDHGEVDK